MEGIIIMIVMFVLSTLFTKDKKKQKETQQMPPFSNQQAPQESTREERRRERPKVRSLDDFTKEVFGQLSEKAESSREARKTIEERVIEPAREELREERKSTRPELGASRPIVQRAKNQSPVIVPSTREQLVQAVITSEILGPPKAKQRK
jgi:hypothetical protein